jgi:outer membrane protein TolC
LAAETNRERENDMRACLKKERGCVEDQPQPTAISSSRRKFEANCGWSRTTQPRAGIFRQALRRAFSHWVLPGAIVIGAALISGCATYHPKPLPTAPDLARSHALTVPADTFALAGLPPHPFPTNGLDETAVITLAVFNNPDLKAARLQAGVADAQLLEAGLLPDPVVSGGLARSPLHTGYNIGLSEDIQALITRGAARAAAKAHARQVNLDIFWQEWQVAEKARELFIQSQADDQLRRVLTRTRDLLANRYHRDEAALKRNNVTADMVSTDLTALTDAETQLRQLQLQSNQTRHALDQLLGLQPDVRLQLVGASKSRSLSHEEFQAAIIALPHRRADLLALQAGYQSQEQRLREAILAQFPSMSAGVEQARSAEEGIHSIGFTVNVTLPIFSRNRGQIAIQQATRAVLHQTYRARLDQAGSEADQIWQATQIMSHQLQNVDARLPALRKIAAAAERNFQRDNLDAATYVSLKSNFLAQQAQAIRLRAALARAQAALEILLGLPFNVPSSAEGFEQSPVHD